MNNVYDFEDTNMRMVAAAWGFALAVVPVLLLAAPAALN